MPKILLVLAGIVSALGCFSQSDTFRIMHYNLLNYGNFPDTYCTADQNPPNVKDSCLRIILNVARPHILCVNEISDNQYYHQRLLDSVLNAMGWGVFARAPFTNFAMSPIVNQLYYDTSRFGFLSGAVVNSYVRDVNLYKLFVKPVPPTGDTSILYCISAHLKAGSTATDKADRAIMTQNVMTWLAQHPEASNVVISGDFNLQSSSETSYQTLINYSTPNLRFYDPISLPGSWNNNASFAAIHTQSTHSSSNGCAASGGMDDRFDFLLVSDELMTGTGAIQYIPGTYKAFGQDGNHLNQSINNGSNQAVSQAVAGALFTNSDHLPVIADFKVDLQNQGTAIPLDPQTPEPVISFSGEGILISLPGFSGRSLEARLFALIGTEVARVTTGNLAQQSTLCLPVQGLKSGVYILSIKAQDWTKTQGVVIP